MAADESEACTNRSGSEALRNRAGRPAAHDRDPPRAGFTVIFGAVQAPAAHGSAVAEAPPALAPPPGHPRFPHVDGLRAIAALSVLAVHVAAFSGVTPTTWIGHFTARLDVGVAIFFVISGFLLYRPFAAAAREHRPPVSPADYGRRRALRILPAYWVALTLLALWPGLPGVLTSDWWHYYGLLQAYKTTWVLGGIPPVWTLCIEVSFYLLLPFYARALRRARGSVGTELLVLAGLAGGTLALRTALHHQGDASILQSTLPGMFDWFAAGMALAVLSAAGRIPRRAGWMWWLAAGALFAVVALAIGAPRGYDESSYSGAAWLAQHVLYGAIAVCLIVPAVAVRNVSGPRRVLATPLLSWLGLISYGIFLWHYPLLAELRSEGVRGWAELAGLGVSVTITCAAISYYLVERPILRFKDRGGRASARRPEREPEPVGAGAG